VCDFNRLRANSLRDETGIFFRGTENYLDRTGKRRERAANCSPESHPARSSLATSIKARSARPLRGSTRPKDSSSLALCETAAAMNLNARAARQPERLAALRQAKLDGTECLVGRQPTKPKRPAATPFFTRTQDWTARLLPRPTDISRRPSAGGSDTSRPPVRPERRKIRTPSMNKASAMP
jgi:hypothetical protein